ncbi:HD-GYP domain-containing protein (c-di-GMP phosphodiesterase class II) [Salirhabdus euzebyi]|uniref:HD-GYP domain-containing protein (C-di-GMP phosphodiesterase class II) n=1 Tax=Salirhabdus euzebyi TaxID=394506 RepID=A0A841PU32_9BACI|nr:HD domain-containing phosphohydrolase [Salirhabdus euzebyi]MBB6452497.1 HD-GYP domain-containing protein (c-di-GMP phosphodiesterase class II) [Salirhabdus euzebyi]
MDFYAFQRTLLRNYIIGSVIAVCIVGSTFVFYTLDLSIKEIYYLIGVLITSLCVMFTLEYRVFKSHIQPIKLVMLKDNSTLEELENAFIRAHHFPSLTVFRIMIPHLLGLSISASLLTSFLIYVDILSLPYSYVGLAWIGAILIASMHAMIEFFLTAKTTPSILNTIESKAVDTYHSSLSLNGKVIVSIRRKFSVSALFIGIFPVLLFGLATQIRLVQLDENIIKGYLSWAGIIILITIVFAIYGSFLLTKEVQTPIEKVLKGMNHVQDGHLKELDNYYSDEFSELISGFNHMVRSIKTREEMNTQLVESFFTVFAATLDARDPYTAGHSIRVADYAVEIGKRDGMSLDELTKLKKSALLHDIGKIGVRDDVLLKDGKLTAEEFEQIKQHPAIGATILEEIKPYDAMKDLIPGVKYHHERYDGKGYPEGLSATNIPLFGRILAVADAFDAMTSNRPYRAGMSFNKAVSILSDGKSTQWDSHYVDLFIGYLEDEKLIPNKVTI